MHFICESCETEGQITILQGGDIDYCPSCGAMLVSEDDSYEEDEEESDEW